MARRRVTYLEVADERPSRSPADRSVVDLGPRRPQGVAAESRPIRQERRACPAWAAQLLLVALLASGALLSHVTTGPDEQSAIDRLRERREARTVTESSAASADPRPGPVVVPTASIVSEPWRGVFEHHPDARGSDPVPRVHVITVSGSRGRALLVVDATRRAFGGPEHPADPARDARVIGSGPGTALRTLQWDAGGYGLSLTSVGITVGEQRALAAAVRLPDGASLQHGRPPDLDPDVLRSLALQVTALRGGAASAFGSPLIGQSGGASIEGQLHRLGEASLLVSVVQDQLVTAATIRDALGPSVAIDARVLPGITASAALDHGPGAAPDRRIRGWARLVLDHPAGATVELSSDVLGAHDLLAAAQAMDLDRLVRTTVPVEAGG